jgi:hypothetical protein
MYERLWDSLQINNKYEYVADAWNLGFVFFHISCLLHIESREKMRNNKVIFLSACSTKQDKSRF